MLQREILQLFVLLVAAKARAEILRKRGHFCFRTEGIISLSVERTGPQLLTAQQALLLRKLHSEPH